MSNKIILTALVTAAALAASCSKQSIIDSQITQDDKEICFTAYSNSTTKGTTIDNTDELRTAAHFKVGAYRANSSEVYIPFSTLSYDETLEVWRYLDDQDNAIQYWWPATENLTFAAHYPTGDVNHNFGYERYEYEEKNGETGYFVFNYTVNHDNDKQDDVLYALKENTPYTNPVNLHFHHALTQIDFQAKLDPALTEKGIDITVYAVELHNIRYTGDFYVFNDTSTEDNALTNTLLEYASYDHTSSETQEYDSENILISEFAAPMRNNGAGINLTNTDSDYTFSDGYTILTTSTIVGDNDAKDATGTGFMLMPQTIEAWNPETANTDITKTGAYLAISCDITQTRTDNNTTIPIHYKEDYLYVPLTTQIDYGDGSTTNQWKAGYKITYKLLFGGGYSTPPGSEYPVETLSPITITATAENWTVVDPDVQLNL